MTDPNPERGRARLVALGYQGFANVGDEAILTGIEALLAGHAATVVAVICGPYPASVVAFPAARRISSPRLLPTLAAIRRLLRADALMLSGGGLFHDHWASIIPRYLAWIALARLAGKPVIWLGVGVGPIRRGSHQVLTRLAVRLTRLALVRDGASAELLGGVSRRVAVVPDPALFNDPPGAVRRRSSEELAIIIRGPTPGHAASAEHLAESLADTYVRALAAGWRPVFMTMAGPADEPFVGRLRRHLGGRDVAVDIEDLGPTPISAMERLSRVRAAISIRLHGLLLASVVGVPCVPVAYDAKVKAAADELGIADLVIDPAIIDADRLLDRVDDACTAERRARVAERMRVIRRQMSAVGQRVVDAVGRSS